MRSYTTESKLDGRNANIFNFLVYFWAYFVINVPFYVHIEGASEKPSTKKYFTLFHEFIL